MTMKDIEDDDAFLAEQQLVEQQPAESKRKMMPRRLREIQIEDDPGIDDEEDKEDKYHHFVVRPDDNNLIADDAEYDHHLGVLLPQDRFHELCAICNETYETFIAEREERNIFVRACM
eukprot:gene24559-10539_t